MKNVASIVLWLFDDFYCIIELILCKLGRLLVHLSFVKTFLPALSVFLG